MRPETSFCMDNLIPTITLVILFYVIRDQHKFLELRKLVRKIKHYNSSRTTEIFLHHDCYILTFHIFHHHEDTKLYDDCRNQARLTILRQRLINSSVLTTGTADSWFVSARKFSSPNWYHIWLFNLIRSTDLWIETLSRLSQSNCSMLWLYNLLQTSFSLTTRESLEDTFHNAGDEANE